MRSIVVGVDESPGAAASLRWAAAERAVHDGALTAVLCWTYLETAPPGARPAFDPDYGDEQAGQALDAIVDGLLADGAPVVAAAPSTTAPPAACSRPRRTPTCSCWVVVVSAGCARSCSAR